MKFSLVIEHGRPVAALIPESLPVTQLKNVYSLLPPDSFSQFDLARRWNLDFVLCRHDWADEQRQREPMLAPKETIALSFL